MRRSQSKELTRVAILNAALASILRIGYQASSLDQIAEDAGFTKGAVYAHFPNKQTLFLQILAAGLERRVTQMEELALLARQSPDTFGPKFIAWLDTLDGEEDIPLLGVELQIEARRNPAFIDQFEDLLVAHQTGLRTALAHIIDATGAVPLLPPELLAGTIIGAAEGLALMRTTTVGGPAASLGQLVEILIGLKKS